MAFSSLVGVLAGGYLSDRWIQTHIRGRIFVSTIGLGLTIPALFLLGFGTEVWHLVGAAICFGLGYGMFDANNMPILCQIVSEKQRGTAYGLMNMCGVFAGALITNILGKSTDQGNLGYDLASLGGLVFIALGIFLALIKPKIAK
jgi:MFS family permease